MKIYNKCFLALACFFLPLAGFAQVEIAQKALNEFMNVRDFCISDNQDEIYFTIQSPAQEISRIACMKKRNNGWSAPELLSFSDVYSDMEPFLSPDQNVLYFASNRPLQDTATGTKDYDIWYVQRAHKNAPWSAPVNMGPVVNSANDEFYPSLSSNKNLYFTMDASSGKGKDDIYSCTYQNGQYSAPQLLPDAINTEGMEFNAFISRDENFLIYTRYNGAGGYGSGDLYLARKNADHTWSKSEHLGAPVNTKYMEYCPYYDEKNETLYFTSRRNSIKTAKFKNVAALSKYLSESENGLSKIYKVNIRLSPSVKIKE